MNVENLRDPNLWGYVGRRITTLGGRVGIFDLDQEGDATEVAAIVCEILANTVYGPAEEWRPPTTQEAKVLHSLIACVVCGDDAELVGCPGPNEPADEYTCISCGRSFLSDGSITFEPLGTTSAGTADTSTSSPEVTS